MKIKELIKYSILSELCYLMLNSLQEKRIEFYNFYFNEDITWLDENKEKIVKDFSKYYYLNRFDYQIKYWDLHYSYLYSDIAREGVDWFDE